MSKSTTRHAVAKISDIPTGERVIATIPAFGKQIEVGVFNVGGRFFAYRNVCPHAGAPVCEGKICGTTAPSGVGEFILERQGEIVRCPWHGWEFDLLTGEHLVDGKMKLRPYAVETGAGNLENYAVETEGDTVFILI
ncbi:MAG TPA: Rieske 2Fe-2S domain-containing protein [Abditibacteriaceae bacterium]|jgi:nitrite reductase/ring-hydroxylating ferredoxin subunit